MTTLQHFSDRNRDQQDGTERHVWDEQTFTKAGSIIRVRGTGTQDEEAVVVNNGIGMQLPKGTNTEVFLLAGGSDTNQKYAMLSIPRDKQRQWAEGNNGLQKWDDPARALEFNSKRMYADDENFATRGGVFEVKGNDVYFRGNVYVGGDVGATGVFKSPNSPQTPPTVGGTSVTVPGFEE
jgi:hypothetical protein